jgi:hypothetical protein
MTTWKVPGGTATEGILKVPEPSRFRRGVDAGPEDVGELVGWTVVLQIGLSSDFGVLSTALKPL